MPAHWYYNRAALRSDYGVITDLVAPRATHPDSILWRSKYRAPNAKGEILHDQAQYWGQRGVHYHQFLQAGESTINLKLAAIALRSIREHGRYEPEDYLRRYVDFMTTPGRHRDTYLEECHRHFFERYALDVDPRRCAAVEKHVGGLAGPLAVAAALSERPDEAREAALEHMRWTHQGPAMESALHLVLDILFELFDGISLEDAIGRRLDGDSLPAEMKSWLSFPDEAVIGGLLSPACYLDDAVPATIYLALKYADDPQRALIVNANLGGDNCHRGAVLGALLGAAHGPKAWPQRWRDGLLDLPPA